MIKLPGKRISGAVAGLLLVLAVAETQAVFTFSPVTVNLLPGKGAVALTVTNPGDKPALMQVETFKWSQREGTDSVEPTEELLAVPPVFTIPPHQSQVVRVALQEKRDVEKEAAYRLLLTELPVKARVSDSKAMVNIAMRVSLPFFVKPAKPSSRLDWEVKRTSPGHLSLTARNTGNVHLQLRKVALFSQPDRRSLGPEKTEVRYLLPDQSASWSFDLTDPEPGKIVVAFEETEQGPREAVLDLKPAVVGYKRPF